MTVMMHLIDRLKIVLGQKGYTAAFAIRSRESQILFQFSARSAAFAVAVCGGTLDYEHRGEEHFASKADGRARKAESGTDS
ncbi:MAG: hypothetical protein ACLUI3_17750 [Christensenellales bacterium]